MVIGLHNILAVHPVQLDRIKDGIGGIDALKIKDLNLVTMRFLEFGGGNASETAGEEKEDIDENWASM